MHIAYCLPEFFFFFSWTKVMKNVQSTHCNQNHPLHWEKNKRNVPDYPPLLPLLSLQQGHTLTVNNLQLVSVNNRPLVPLNTIHWMCIGRNLHWQFNVISLFRQRVGPCRFGGSVSVSGGKVRLMHASQHSTWLTTGARKSEESRRALRQQARSLVQHFFRFLKTHSAQHTFHHCLVLHRKHGTR